MLPDIHVPAHDTKTIAAVLAYVRGNRPWDAVALLGDVLDLSCISSHNKNNLRATETARVKAEYSQAEELIAALRSSAGGPAPIYWIQGNHEERAERLINAQPALEGVLEIEKNIPLRKHGVLWVPYWSTGEPLHIGKATFIHGVSTNKYHAQSHASAYQTNIFYGHCFSHDTELLTPRGWVRGPRLSPTDPVMTLNTETDKLEFQVPSSHVSYSAAAYPELLWVRGQNTDVCVTEDHGMIQTLETGEFSFLTAKNLAAKKSAKIPHARPIAHAPGMGLTDDQIRLLIWIVTDGSCENKTYNKSFACRWHLKKPRKLERLSALLSRLGIRFSEQPSYEGRRKIYARLPDWVKFYVDKRDKHMPEALRFATVAQIEVVLEEIIHTDGCLGNNTIQYSTAQEREADLVQELAIYGGHRANKTRRPRGWVVSINRNRGDSWITPENWERVGNTQDVWCVSVANGTLVTRRNGKVTITQNTHDVQSFSLVSMGDNHTRIGQSLGCLCKYQQPYLQGKPTKWQQAFATFYFSPGGNFQYYVTQIFNHRFVGPDGKEYGG